MLKYFFYNYILLNTKDYSNIELDMYPNILLLGGALLLITCFILLHIKRRAIFALVSTLMRREAYGEDTAVTLSKLRLNDSKILRFLLRFDNEICRTVTWVGRPSYTYEEYRDLVKSHKPTGQRPDPEKDSFYLDPKQINRAKFIFDNYDSSITKTVLCAVLILTISCMIVIVSPELMSLINNALGSIL